jgi:hypothetical protein
MPPYSTGKTLGTPVGNWVSELLPYLDARSDSQKNRSVFPCVDCEGKKNIVPGTGLNTEHLGILTCPSDFSAPRQYYWGTTNYLANWYALDGSPSGGYYAPAKPLATLRNGLSNTVIFAEAYKICSGLPRMSMTAIHYHNFGVTQQAKPSDDPIYQPNDYTMFQVQPALGTGPNACDRWRTQTPHHAMNVCLADGSVRNVAGDISPSTWKQVLKTAGPLPIGADW